MTSTPPRRTTPPRFAVGVVVLMAAFLAVVWVAWGWLISVIARNLQDGVSVLDGMAIAYVIWGLSRHLHRRD